MPTRSLVYYVEHPLLADGVKQSGLDKRSAKVRVRITCKRFDLGAGHSRKRGGDLLFDNALTNAERPVPDYAEPFAKRCRCVPAHRAQHAEDSTHRVILN